SDRSRVSLMADEIPVPSLNDVVLLSAGSDVNVIGIQTRADQIDRSSFPVDPHSPDLRNILQWAAVHQMQIKTAPGSLGLDALCLRESAEDLHLASRHGHENMVHPHVLAEDVADLDPGRMEPLNLLRRVPGLG